MPKSLSQEPLYGLNHILHGLQVGCTASHFAMHAPHLTLASHLPFRNKQAVRQEGSFSRHDAFVAVGVHRLDLQQWQIDGCTPCRWTTSRRAQTSTPSSCLPLQGQAARPGGPLARDDALLAAAPG